MSNSRKISSGNRYRNGYLRSTAWYDRRREWFTAEMKQRGCVRCTICLRRGDVRTLELHHIDYSGIREGVVGWVSGEEHTDLVAAHPRCHGWIHKLIERDMVLRGLVSRRSANIQAIIQLREKRTRQLIDWTRNAR